MRSALLLVLLNCSKPSAPVARHDAALKPDPLSAVDVSATGSGVGWDLHVKNRTDAAIAVVWNESAFVDSSGQSLGRIVPGTTRQIDLGKPIADEPIPAGAFIDEFVSTGQLADWAEHYRPHCGTGRLSIALRTSGGPITWTGSGSYDVGQIPQTPPLEIRDAGLVEAAPVRRVVQWCFDESGDHYTDTKCAVTQDACDDLRRHELVRFDTTECRRKD
jgi:hypothetical protein